MPHKSTRAAVADPDQAALSDPVMKLDADPVPRRRAASSTGRAAGRPRTKPGARDAGGRVLSHAAQVDKVRADLTEVLVLGASGIALKDSCAERLFEEVPRYGHLSRLEAIIERAVNIVARNPKVLSAAASGGVLVEVAALVGLVAPVLMTVWQHHGPGGVGHDDEQAAHDANIYPSVR